MAIQFQTTMLRLNSTDESTCVYISGDWVLAHYSLLINEIKKLKGQLHATTEFDLSQLGNLDTAGAALLADLLGAERLKHLPVLTAELSIIVILVSGVTILTLPIIIPPLNYFKKKPWAFNFLFWLFFPFYEHF